MIEYNKKYGVWFKCDVCKERHGQNFKPCIRMVPTYCDHTLTIQDMARKYTSPKYRAMCRRCLYDNRDANWVLVPYEEIEALTSKMIMTAAHPGYAPPTEHDHHENPDRFSQLDFTGE